MTEKIELKTDKARRLLAEGKTVPEIAKELGVKSPGWIYSLKTKAKKTAPKVKRPYKARAKNGNGHGVIKERTGFFFMSSDFPVAFATESVGQKYLGEKATLTKVAVLLS